MGYSVRPLAVPTPKDAVWYLRIGQDRADGVIVLTLEGRVSHLTCAELDAALATAAASGARAVIVDLTAVDYISSPGLRALERASAALAGTGRRFAVCGLQDAVTVAFDLGGLTGTLTVEPSRPAAMAAATGVEAPAIDTSRHDV
jgi:anti-anti-sigma factor